MEGKAVSVVEKERPVRGTHRSLEGLGYLGMLSAAPTDMGSSLLQEADMREQETVTQHNLVCEANVGGASAERKKRTMPRWARSA